MPLKLYREWGQALQVVGELGDDGSYTYDTSYLASSDSRALSHSLPLQAETFTPAQARPYFEGLLPEGTALASLAADLGRRADDYLGILAECGLDCVGDVIINPDAYTEKQGYEPIVFEDLAGLERPSASAVRGGGPSRLSLAGTQSKVGLFHEPGMPISEGWYRPMGGAASNCILKFASEELPDLMLVEQLTMSCAAACGLDVAESHLLDFGARPAIAVQRFDRLETSGRTVDGLPAPQRRHQEDLSQAFGIDAASKYAQLEGGTIARIGSFLDDTSSAPAADKIAFFKLLMFNYAIGNCDNHLKNHSVLYSPNWKTLRLAPAYDLVATTCYARFSRDMGIAIGSSRSIDDINSEDFLFAARQLLFSDALVGRMAGELTSKIVDALREANRTLEEQGFESAWYYADRIEEDTAPRLEVLRELT